MDTSELKRTWALAESLGDPMPLFFYSHLFVTNPQLREMFPVAMGTQRDRLVAALGHIVTRVDELDTVTEFIQQLGRDHRRFAVVAEHYDAVGASLLATLEHFLGDAWTPELQADWTAAYGVIANAMIQAAEESERDTPSVWKAEVLRVDRRSPDIAVVQLRPEPAFEFEPGQSTAIEIPQHPRLWRYFSLANAPRESGTLEVHVQLVPAGEVSMGVMTLLRAGDVVRLGAPVGASLTLPRDAGRDLLMVAGGTGLAPLRAHLEQIDRKWRKDGQAPTVFLYHGARTRWNLYEDRLMRQLDTRPWFNYIPVVSEDSGYEGRKGLVGDVAAADRDWRGYFALVCGSQLMVRYTTAALQRAGIPPEDLRFERFIGATSTISMDALHNERVDRS